LSSSLLLLPPPPTPLLPLRRLLRRLLLQLLLLIVLLLLLLLLLLLFLLHSAPALAQPMPSRVHPITQLQHLRRIALKRFLRGAARLEGRADCFVRVRIIVTQARCKIL
jgi:hypothetical protein